MNATTGFTQTTTTFDVAETVAMGYIVHFFNSQDDFKSWLNQEAKAGNRHNCTPRRYAKGRQYDAKDHRFEIFC
jgi:hypothetical protein